MVIVLEEPALPLVSVQMLYRVGAKHELPGSTGLAHFFEHMAFRSSENFPGTEVVSRIYAAGGEWHGYTWLDQTTYFSTAPRTELELLLRIEADRMARLDIPADMVEAERGAVLTEMHGYENDPDAVLQDQVLYLSFLAHGYRNNTIGWESDVAAIGHDELVAFYREHYHPGNAVLAVVGDVGADEVLRLVQRHFGGLAGRAPTPAPRTVEPPQNGERRLRLQGPVRERHYKIAWRAPSVHSDDFAAFLLLQEMLAGGSGISFLQNDWGTAARPDSVLSRHLPGARTWFPPAEQDYVFTLSGALSTDGDEKALEAAVAAALDELDQRLNGVHAAALLADARAAVRRALVFDVETTEDAAHQLAFFAGMDALDLLLGLPEALAEVTPADIARVLRQRLDPSRRTIGWYVPAAAVAAKPSPAPSATKPVLGEPAPAQAPDLPTVAGARVATPQAGRLGNGMPFFLQTSPLASTLHLRLVLPGLAAADRAESLLHEPAWGLSTLAFEGLAGELPALLAQARGALAAARPIEPEPTAGLSEPEDRMQALFAQALDLARPPLAGKPGAPAAPLLLVLAGDFESASAETLLEGAFGDLPTAADWPRPTVAAPANRAGEPLLQSVLPLPRAQERLGYIVPAPAPNEPTAAAWAMILYVLSHGYEGRLGKEAISNRGLVYYIDSSYHSDGRRGWITLETGVDPARRGAMQALLTAELQRLRREAPSKAEIEEARRHLLGRRLSAAQSNRELAERLARDWAFHGQPLSWEALRERLAAISREDVLQALPAFSAGTLVAVRNPPDD
jgi:predicted Zn-dependent peptidase